MSTAKTPSTTKATLLIVISSGCFGSLSILTLFAMRSGIGLVPAMFWRYTIAICLASLLCRNQLMQRMSRAQAIRLMTIGACGQALVTYMSLKALDYMPVGPLAFLFYTYPAWLAAISTINGREKLDRTRLIALIVAMSGIVLMVGAPSASAMNIAGVTLALGAALLYALYLPELHRAQTGIPAGVSMFYLLLGVFIAFSIASVASGQFTIPRSPATWSYLALLSIVGTIIAFLTLISGLRTLGPVRTSIISTIEPFFTAALGALLLGETLTVPTIVGGGMIASAVVLLEWTGRAPATTPAG